MIWGGKTENEFISKSFFFLDFLLLHSQIINGCPQRKNLVNMFKYRIEISNDLYMIYRDLHSGITAHQGAYL